MLTCGLLIFIIAFSFFLSKMNKVNTKRNHELRTQGLTGINKPVIYIPVSKKNKSYFPGPQIFHMNHPKPKEVNIILKSTMLKSSPATNNEMKKTNSKKSNQRYTIVNDEQYKNNNRAANYYL